MTLDIPQLRSSLKRILANFDVQTFKVEEYYLYLKEKENRTEDEQFIFEVMDSFYNIYKDCPQFLIPYLDWDGLPLSFWEWCFKFNYFDRHVGKDILNGYLISTVWLGMNHSFFKDHPPLIYETMIFPQDNALPDNEELNYYQERYSTYEEALEGHKRACELVIKNTKKVIYDNHN